MPIRPQGDRTALGQPTGSGQRAMSRSLLDYAILLGSYVGIPVGALVFEIGLKALMAFAADWSDRTRGERGRTALLTGGDSPSGYSFCVLGLATGLLIALNRDRLADSSTCLRDWPVLSLIASTVLSSLSLGVASVLCVRIRSSEMYERKVLLSRLVIAPKPGWDRLRGRLERARARKLRAVVAALGVFSLFVASAVFFGI